MTSLSIFEYLYRDASNYKAWGTLVLEGDATDADIAALLIQFESGSYFIAEQLGIPPLYSELWAFSSGPTADDHVWHTFHALRTATAQDIAKPIFCTLGELIQKVKAVTAWDETLSPHWGI